MTGHPRGARTVLALVVALQLVAETALTPYWPALFRDLFGEERLIVTGNYLTVCRVAGLAALPLWGLAARRWPLPRLLVAGLLVSAICDAGLAAAPDIVTFSLLSAGVVAAGSSLVLAYPALVSVVEARGAGNGTTALVLYAGVFHAAALVATLVGAAVVALPEPRVGLAMFAVLDIALAVLVWRFVAASPAAEPALPRPAKVGLRTGISTGLLVVVAVAVLVDLGTAVTRPFFVELALHRGQSLTIASVLFLLPSAAALAVLPVARAAAGAAGPTLLPGSAVLAAVGLLTQAFGTSLAAMASGRALMGAGLALAMVAVDLRVFSSAGTAGPTFAVVETARSAALLAAPLVATAAASDSLTLPLFAGALMLLGAALTATVRTPTKEMHRVTEAVH